MSCSDFEEQINLLIDGELEETRHSVLYSHLEQCSDCRTLLDGILRMRQTIQGDRPAFPEELDDRMLNVIGGHKRAANRAPGKRMGVPIPLAAAAVIILAVAAFLLGRSMKADTPVQNRETQTALVTTAPRVEILYGLPSIEVVGYSSQIIKSDSL